MRNVFSKFVTSVRKHSATYSLLAVTLIATSGCAVRVYGPEPVVRVGPRGHYVYDAYGRLVWVPYYYEPGVVVAPAPVVVAPAPAPAPPPAVVTTETPAVQQIEPLVAPIALYPDPLLAVVLPASTYPQQVQEAAGWLAANPNPAPEAIDAQQWDPAIKALVRYPAVLNQMNGDINWTTSLGSAYSANQTDVMAAVQQMRAQAAAQNNLVSNAQQTVVQSNGVIAIQPANPVEIYVPTYDPVVVYTTPYTPLVWSVGFPVGPWFCYGFNWWGGALFVGDWRGPFIYEGGFWHRDFYWHADRFHPWVRDARFGFAPHVDHFAFAHGMGGREGEIHRAMAEHAAVRREHIAKSVAASHAEREHAARPGTGHEAQHPAGHESAGAHHEEHERH